MLALPSATSAVVAESPVQSTLQQLLARGSRGVERAG